LLSLIGGLSAEVEINHRWVGLEACGSR
jgi:hypothetical protein